MPGIWPKNLNLDLKLFCAAIAGLAICLFAVWMPSESLAQENVDSNLPKHAVWRFGQYGKTPNANGIYRIVYSPDGKYMATRNQENVVVIYDTQTRKQLCEVEPHEFRVQTIDFSPDSQYFVTASGPNEKVKVWETKSAKLAAEIETDGVAAYFNSDGNGINVLGETHVERYSWPGVQMEDQNKWKSSTDKRVSMSRDGRMVVGYKHHRQRTFETFLRDVDSKSKELLSGTNAQLKSAKFSPDNNWLAATYQGNFRVYLWDLREDTKRAYTLTKHKSTAQSISFSSDSRFLVSSGWDKKVIAWDLATRQAISEFSGHTDNVNSTGFAPLSYTFASGASGTTDCSAIVWNMKSLLFKPEHKPDPNSKESIEKQFESIWRSLGVSSFKVSIKATSKFAQSGDLYLDAFSKQIATSITAKSAGSIEESIALLSHPEFAKRVNATNDLIKNRQKADAKLREAFRTTTSLETRFRISMILKQKAPRPRRNFVENRRWQRSLWALEEINSKRSQDILLEIANGHEISDVADLARDCHDRNVLRAKLSAEQE